MSFPKRLAEVAALVEARFEGLLAERYGNLPLHQAMRYALQGGKRLRAFLALESARMHNVPQDQAIYPALAIEALHAYSLVHDDLPCMDDDDLRRGRPTVHKKWDEATAVLAGDALQSLAFQVLMWPNDGVSDTVRCTLARGLSTAAGQHGMVRGQAKDLAAEVAETQLTLEEIIDLQNDKTGALIQWSATVGPIMSPYLHLNSVTHCETMATYGEKLGLAFQIADDILDVTGDAATVGKAVGKDADAGKATFVSLLGLDAAKSRARELVTEACDCLSIYGADADGLRDCARFVISRDS